MTFHPTKMMRVGLCVVGILGLLLWSQLQAAPRAPRYLQPNQSCVNDSCHKEQTSYKRLHLSRFGKFMCKHCHKPVQANRHKFKPADKTQTTCIGCHKDFKPGHGKRKHWRFEHGPVAVGACLTCHNPHGSNKKNLMSHSQAKLCMNCHNDLSASRSGLHKTHKPVKDAKCMSCHEAHGSKDRHMLHPNLVQKCLHCHKKVKTQLANVKSHHGAVLRGQQCMNCHTGHERRHKAMLKKPDSKLCLSCHNKSVVLRGKKQLINIKKHLATHKNHHDPIKKGKCTACHSAHGSMHEKLFVKAFPAMLYSTFTSNTYALCFSCHKIESITSKQTYKATKFRNGAFNLHFLHVRRKKSRSCRFCHDPHASNKPHLMRESIRFGSWNLKVGFKSQNHGGLCQTACHEPRRYNRKKPENKGYERYRKLLAAPHLQSPKGAK